jgi:hypothetical protein
MIGGITSKRFRDPQKKIEQKWQYSAQREEKKKRARLRELVLLYDSTTILPPLK